MEQPLLPFTSCNLSALNLVKFVVINEETGEVYFDYDKLYDDSMKVMGLMDNIIDTMEFPDERFEINTKNFRPVGIGVMGMSDAMYLLDIAYDGADGKKFAGEVMKTITTACIHKSALLAKERGKFYKYDFVKDDMLEIVRQHTDNNEEIIEIVKENGLRNCQYTTCAPTGTTAISCDTSYGIEPCFGLVFKKNLIDGGEMNFINPIFKSRFENEEWFTDKLLEKIAQNGGSLKGLHGIPKHVKEVFVVAHDIKPKDRIDVQAILQKYCSSGISSTVNLPSSCTKEEISDLYTYAYRKGLKGVTVYRDGCKKNQPVSFKEKKGKTEFVRPVKMIADEYKLNCAMGSLYLSVSKDGQGNPMEVVVRVGKSGQELNSMTEALGRVISIALQNDVGLPPIIKTLEGITDRPSWSKLDQNDKKPTQIMSIPDAVAKILDRHYIKNNYIASSSIMFGEERCKVCGSKMIVSENCLNCPSCGSSKCS